jgi:pimeloyl-ACP methyl ester carboxylesterase
MKCQAIVIALLACITLPARGDDIADWWQAYATDTRLVTLSDGKQLSLLCMGEGTPVVMMEAGVGVAGIISWRNVQPAIGRLTKVCAYDRPGVWNSALTDDPRDAGVEADDLAALLKAAELPAPYLLVGHSLGGIITRLYASRHTSDVAGLLLIDPSSAHQLDRLTQALPGVVDSDVAAIEFLKNCAIDPRPAEFLTMCQVPPLADMPQELTERHVSSLAPARASHLAREFMALNELSSALLDQEKKSLGAIPFVVLNRDPTRLDPALSADDGVVSERVWLQMHLEIMDLSSDSELHIVPGASHIVQDDRPDAVINTVTDMVLKIRRKQQQ